MFCQPPRLSTCLRTLACCALLLGQTLQAQTTLTLDSDGTVHMPAQAVPLSPLMSDEGRAYLNEHLQNLRNPAMLQQVDGVPVLLAGYLARQRELFPATTSDTTIGGVHAIVYTPSTGIAAENQDKVLINLHGGGFSGCWLGCAELESRPIAERGRIKVVSLDYRQSPDHTFPAASEDVAAAYRELIASYQPQNIGIYGCSAGGMLTAMAVAWFQQHELPRPGAIGILCAGAAPTGPLFGGDAGYFTFPLGEGRAMPTPPASGGPGIGAAYLAGTDPNDPLVAPANHPEVLAQFPPTLILSGTRSYDLSNAVHTHIALAKQNVPAELYVWEGMFHGFFYNPDVPESQECFDFIVRFFNQWLGKV